MSAFNLELSSPDHNTAIIYADLAVWCRKEGISLSQNDLWIAATAVQNTARLLMLDAELANLPQITVVPI